MSDLDTRLQHWVDGRTAGVDPVTVDEVVTRARTGPIPLEPHPARRTHRALAVAAVIALVTLAAVSVVILTRDDTQDVVTDIDNSFEGLANLVPDDLGQGIAALGDYEGARQRTGIRRPRPDAPVGEHEAYVDRLVEHRAWPLAGPQEIVLAATSAELRAALREELGIEPAQVTAAAQWGQPPDVVSVFVGQFDDRRIDSAARELPEPWGTALSTHEHRGVPYYSWFPDFDTDLSRALRTNALGTSRRVAVVRGHLILTRGTGAMEATIDAILDGRRSRVGDLVRGLGQRFGVLLLPTFEVEGAGPMVVASRALEADRAGPWEIHVAITGDSERLREELERAVSMASQLGGWEHEWRDSVTIRIASHGAVIAIEESSLTLAELPAGQGQVGSLMLSQIAQALSGGPVQPRGLSPEELR